VHAGFDILALDDRIDGIGRGGYDVAAANRPFCRIDRNHLDAGLLAHFRGEALTIFFGRAVDFDFAQLPNHRVSG
jgi:hypothetical protein